MNPMHFSLIIEVGIIGLLVVLLALVFWLAKRDKKHASEEKQMPPVSGEISGRQIPSLLTPPELACFNTLHLVAGKEYHVMAKVSLSDIAVVKQGVDKSLLDRVAKKGLRDVDFILCSKNTLAVACAIEIGDTSGSKRDFTLGDFLRELGIPYFRLPVKTTYSMPEIRGILEPFLKERPPTPDEMVATVSMEAYRACKSCKSRMVLKRAKSGKYKGVLFWVCSRYPECKTMELFTR